jgi:hypothetical protein
MFVSLVLMGNSYRADFGDAWESFIRPKKGFHSHMSPTGNQYIVFDAAQTLPFFLITYSTAYNARIFDIIHNTVITS